MDSLGVLPSALPPAVAARSATPKEIIEHLQLTLTPSLLVHAGLFVLHVSTSLDTLLLSMCFTPGLRFYGSMQVSGHILNAVEGNTAQDYGRAQRFTYLEWKKSIPQRYCCNQACFWDRRARPPPLHQSSLFKPRRRKTPGCWVGHPSA